MKIGAISDMHLPGRRTLDFLKMSKNIPELDVLIIAGDISINYDFVDKALEYIKNIPARYKLIIPGNHDISQKNKKTKTILNFFQQKEKTIQDLYNTIRQKFKQNGFHMLDKNPLIIDNIGFIGNIGWYDYSFKIESDIEFIVNNKRKKLSDFTQLNYKEKQVKYKGSTYTWPDKNNITLNDTIFLNDCVNQLESDIKKISKDTNNIVTVLHHLPFEDNLLKSDDPFIQFASTYMGSKQLGNLIKKYKQIKTVIHGHAHITHGKYNVDDIDCYNVCFDSKDPKITIIDI